MNKSTRDFLNLFFNEDETICVSDSKYGYHSIDQRDIITPHLISSNNEIAPRTISEQDILLMALNPIKGFREDVNVTAFRSFLVEVDFGALSEQYNYIKSSELPYSVCVFSGNKSLHFGIVLDTDMPSENEWRRISEWILSILTKADPLTKNPSRSIRFPGNIRKDGKGLAQKMLELKKRIPVDELYAWLNKHPDKDPLLKQIKNSQTIMPTIDGVPVWIINKLKNGIDPTKGRNNQWFSMAMGLAIANFEINDIISLLDKYFVPERDFTRRELITTIKSAVKKASKKNVS